MPRPRGRPRLDEHDATTSITVRIPGRQFDEVCRRAFAARISMPEYVRAVIKRAIREGVAPEK